MIVTGERHHQIIDENDETSINTPWELPQKTVIQKHMDLANGDLPAWAGPGGGGLIVLEEVSDLGEEISQGDKEMDCF